VPTFHNDATRTWPSDRLPSSVSDRLGLFDRFASAVERLVSRAPFFAVAVAIVVAWLIEGAFKVAAEGPHAFLGDTFQLQINTVTTVITFLLVALLQNTQARDNLALQDKLNAIAEGLSVLMGSVHSTDKEELDSALRELRAAVGLEEKVGAEDQPRD
jgi:low affinity Fe/Cu permease